MLADDGAKVRVVSYVYVAPCANSFSCHPKIAYGKYSGIFPDVHSNGLGIQRIMYNTDGIPTISGVAPQLRYCFTILVACAKRDVVYRPGIG